MSDPALPGYLPDQIRLVWPVERWADLTTVVAVSGGADSVALLLAMRAMRRETRGAGELVVAHVHHGLRGEHANQDQQFVSALADRLGLPCVVKALPLLGRADDSAVTGPPAPEAALRMRRYEALTATAREQGARYLVTAHHADDQAETVLFRMMRGTGLDGLVGIRPFRHVDESLTLCRPLLAVRREAILCWLAAQGESWREDASNTEIHYSRNRIRHRILPEMREAVPGEPVMALCDLASAAGELVTWLDDRAAPLIVAAFEIQPGRLVIDTEAIGDDRFLIRHAVRRAWHKAGLPAQAMDRSRWERMVDALLENQNNGCPEPFALPERISVSVEGSKLIACCEPKS